MSTFHNAKGFAMLPAGMQVAAEEHDRICTTMPDNTGWQKRHLAAWDAPKSLHELSLGSMLKGWLRYADGHRRQFESTIGEDYVLGPEWQALGNAIHGLLDGETGRFDCGTLSTIIRNAQAGEGWDSEGDRMKGKE